MKKMQLWFSFVFLIIGTNVCAQIPVTDVASIAKQVANQAETIMKWQSQYQQMTEQINQAQRMYQSMTGSRGMGTILNNPSAQIGIPREWTSVAGKSLPGYSQNRSKYPTRQGYNKYNALFDILASQDASMEEIYKSTTTRQQQVQQLLTLIDTADDPAAKADLHNRLINEQNAIASEANALAALQQLNQREVEEAQRAANQELVCKEFGRTSC